MEPNFDKNPWEYEHGHEHGCHDMHHHGHDPYRGHWKPDHCHMHHHFGAPPCPPGMPKDVYERFVNKMARHLMKQEEYAKAGTALFDGIIDESIRVEAVASMVDTGRVLYSKKDRCFVYQVENRYYIDWRTMPAYNNDDCTVRKDKVYVYNGWMYHYDAAQKDLVKYLEVGGDDDRELIYKLDDEEKDGLVDALEQKVIRNDDFFELLYERIGKKKDLFDIITDKLTDDEEFIESFYQKLYDKKKDDDAIADIAMQNRIEQAADKAVERKMAGLVTNATMEYSEVSSFRAEYDADVNKLRMDLRLPFKELSSWYYGDWDIAIQFDGNIETFPKEGGEFTYRVYAFRPKWKVINGEKSEDFEIEYKHEANVIAELVPSDYAHADMEGKVLHIQDNPTDQHRNIEFIATWGALEKRITFEQCH